MMRTFDDWWRKASQITDSIPLEGEKPQLNQVNYVWINNLISDDSEETNPTVDELVEWISCGMIDAIRK